jgi:hexosaminidase
MVSTQGGLHALETFSQLFYTHSRSVNMVYTPYAPVVIEDGPAFVHRGLNLDISRNWISPSHVRRTIEAMAFNKFNRLHMHASDAQSWPLNIPTLPELAREGTYHPDQIYHDGFLGQLW